MWMSGSDIRCAPHAHTRSGSRQRHLSGQTQAKQKHGRLPICRHESWEADYALVPLRPWPGTCAPPPGDNTSTQRGEKAQGPPWSWAAGRAGQRGRTVSTPWQSNSMKLLTMKLLSPRTICGAIRIYKRRWGNPFLHLKGSEAGFTREGGAIPSYISKSETGCTRDVGGGPLERSQFARLPRRYPQQESGAPAGMGNAGSCSRRCLVRPLPAGLRAAVVSGKLREGNNKSGRMHVKAQESGMPRVRRERPVWRPS